MSLRGKRVNEAKRALRATVVIAPDDFRGQRHTAVQSTKGKSNDIIVVDDYKHLGSFITSSTSLTCEALHRAVSAMAAIAPLSITAFACPSATLQRMLSLANAVILFRFL